MKNSEIRVQATILLIGYSLQFLAGMFLNLFVIIPSTHSGSSGSEYFSRSMHSLVWALADHGGWVLAFHVYLALGLVLGSISLFIKAMLHRQKRWSIASGLAALTTIGAFFNGLSFIDYNKDVSSMIMATCWLVAVGALAFGLARFGTQGHTKKRA